MMSNDRRSRVRTPMAEGLESRNLLSVGVGAHPAAVVHELKVAIPAIKGTINGTVTSVTPTSATTRVVGFSAHGKANIIGDGDGTGQFTITSKAVKKHPTNDTYKNGSATIAGTTDTVSIRYTGTGHTNANGKFTATLQGRATSISGQHAGLSGSFTAQLTGNNQSGSFQITFSVKV